MMPGGGEARKFIFATPDGWTYRLIDTTHVDSGSALRQVICNSLGLLNNPEVQFYITSLGQFDHDEAVSEIVLMQMHRTIVDAEGKLKIYVHAPGQTSPYLTSVISAPESAGLGIGTQLNGSTVDSQLKSGESTLIPTNSSLRAGNSPTDRKIDRSQSANGRMWTPNDLAEEARRLGSDETDRARSRERGGSKDDDKKSKKKGRKASTPTEDGESPSIRRPGYVHDFDTPRESPYESGRPFEQPTKPDPDYVPRRQAPPAPPESKTLIKANSLTKKKGQQFGDDVRRSWPDKDELPSKRQSGEQSDRGRRNHSPTGGIGAALVGIGDALRAAGNPSGGMRSVSATQPSNSSSSSDQRGKRAAKSMAGINWDSVANAGRNNSPGGSPRSPGSFTMSKGNIPFKIPDYEEDVPMGEPSSRPILPPLKTNGAPLATNPAIRRLQGEIQEEPAPSSEKSPDVSPNTPQPPNRRDSKKRENFSFPEPDVSFRGASSQENTLNGDDSDADSDDGLFAVVLKRPSNKDDESPIPKQAPTPPREGRPSLTLQTSQVNEVRFQSPHQSATENSASTLNPEKENSFMKESDGGVPASAISTTYSPDEPMRTAGNRDSFVSDVWAHRPPVEAVAERLDDFFPNIDLDQPVIEEEEGATGSPISGSSNPLKRGETLHSVAQRNIKRSGGLGRTRSIRDVVRGAYQQGGPERPAPVHGLNRMETLRVQSNIVRRKSTKMFGARIEQVRPRGGSRMIPMERIPDHVPIAQPQRQPTFKWLKGQLIGKGTFGRVYLGMNMTTGELIAVKQVEVNPKSAGQDKERMKALMKSLDGEIDTMQHLDHPNIVSYLGCERKEYAISIFLEYISGGSIGSCLRKHGKFEESVVSSLTRQTLCGLAYLHGQGILHRDLKADNILLDIDGTCKISDFGISKKTDNIYGNDITNSMQGSVFWMAPEVIRSQGQGYSAKVDIWSLGCVVLEMFAGRRPWSKEEAIGAIYKLGSLNQAPPIPDEVSENISIAAVSFMYDCFTM